MAGPYGLLIQLTHTGLSRDSVHVSDVQDGVDVLASFRKAGPIYVPTPAKGGIALLVYAGDVAISFERGGIRKFIEGGYLSAIFVVGTALIPVLTPSPERILTTADSPATQLLSDVVVSMDLSTGAGSYTLLPAAQWNQRIVRIKKYDLSENAITILAAPGETIDQSPAAVFTAPMVAFDMFSNGTVIKILG